LAAPALLAGCSKPNQANIKLRKDNQELRSNIESLRRLREGQKATIAALESHATTVPVLPVAQLEELFTVHGLKFGKLTGASASDPQQPGDDGFKIYVVPVDESNQPLKAAGSFVIEAFDLAEPGGTRIALCEYNVEQARQLWYGQAMLYEYVIPCKWETPPRHPEITLKVTFTDALTHRTFTEQKVIRVKPMTGEPPKSPR
jgi:hypothetical protein